MRAMVGVVVAGALAVAARAVAMAPPEPTTQDYVREIQASTPPGAGSPAAQGCDNGEARDESGACPVVDDSQATRGFTLFSGSMAKPRGPADKATTPTAAAVRDVRPAQPSATVRCGLLCDLKVNFKSGSAELTADSDVKLAKFAEALRDPSLAGKRFEIAGHTDASGSPERNRALSQARAEAVKMFLVAHGVPTARLEAKGYGSEGLALPNLPLDPRNRRVEARVLN